MNELALFAGAGGGLLASLLSDWRTVCAVELDAYCAQRLMQRQNEGYLPPFPVWDDVRSFDGSPWRGFVDVVSGGFPCQDISAAGNREGIDGKRSGLWSEMARIIREVGPSFVFVENSPMLTVRGLGRVLGDLASMGFDAEWGVLGASDVGAPHLRKRMWIVANSHGFVVRDEPRRQCGTDGQGKAFLGVDGEEQYVPDTRHQGEHAKSVNAEVASASEYVGHSERTGLQGGREDNQATKPTDTSWWRSEPGVGRVVDGLAHRVDRLKALGNGQVPAVAAGAWEMLKGQI